MTKNKKPNKNKTKSVLDDLRVSKNEMKAIAIKDELNKLFYAKPKYKEELEMMEFQYAQEYEERIGLHASAITGAGSGFCFRQQVLSLFYKMDQGGGTPIHLARIYEEGKSIGTKWQRLFIRAGIADKEDLDVSRMQDDYDLSYTPDAIIEIFGKKHVVEIKSQNTNEFQKSSTHKSGLKQLKLYMYFEEIDQGFVLVEDKNTQDFKVIYIENVTEDDPDVAKFLEILETIQKHKRKFVKKKKMVARHEKCTSSDCNKARWCPMRDACWNVGKGRERIGKVKKEKVK